MTYDGDALPDPTQKSTYRPPPAASGRDLETIVILLELAAIELTTGTGVTFTRDTLVNLAREIGGDEIELLDTDVNIVLKNTGFLKQVRKNLFCLK